MCGISKCGVREERQGDAPAGLGGKDLCWLPVHRKGSKLDVPVLTAWKELTMGGWRAEEVVCGSGSSRYEGIGLVLGTGDGAADTQMYEDGSSTD